MILFQETHAPTSAYPINNSWFLDTASLALARVTISVDRPRGNSPDLSACRFSVEIDTVMPDDPDAASGIGGPMEPFSPSTMAARIMAELTEKIHPDLRLARVGMIGREEAAPPEYLDFYEVDGDGVFIMHTCAPVFVARFVGEFEIDIEAWRACDDLSAMGWCYYTCEAYDELVALNARRSEKVSPLA